MLALGIVLIVLGIVAIAAGIGGGITKMVHDYRSEPRATTALDPFAPLEKLLTAVKELVVALTRAPTWLALTLIGFGLVIYGAWLAGAS